MFEARSHWGIDGSEAISRRHILDDDTEGEGRRARSRKTLLFLSGLVVIAVALIALWAERKPIARNYVDKFFARSGVPAHYEITRFGFRRQRIEHVVVGDPQSPDLTADWVELGFGISGVTPSLREFRAHGVRLKGRLVDGRVSLGAIDRLLPAPSGEPFALPQLYLMLDDARMRLETPGGIIGLALSGRGNLAGGFLGRLAGVADRLDADGCVIERPTAILHIATADRQPAVDGPLQAARASCGASAIDRPRSAIDVSLSPELDQWRGGAVFASDRIMAGRYGAASGRGRITFNGNAHDSDGRLSLALQTLRLPDVASAMSGFRGTPLGPIALAVRSALAAATRHVDVDASLHFATAGKSRTLHVAPLTITSSSGAHLSMDASGERGIGWRWPGNRLIADGKLSLSGGGFPDAVLRIRQSDTGLQGKLWMQPFAAGNARLALDPLSFGGGGFATRVRMTGPLADGYVEALDLPLDGRLAGGGVRINPHCVPLSFARLDIAGARIGPSKLPLCPLGGALFMRTADGRVAGGASIATPSLRGRIGDAPLLMSARRLTASVAKPGFAIDDLAVRLGAGGDPTRLDARQLNGDVASSGLAGTLSGAAGKIGGVPLLVSNAEGRWSLRSAVLDLNGSLDLDDASPDPRFHQLTSKDVRLDLRNGVISGAATLVHPRGGQRITHVELAHDLNTGNGHATLDVPAIAFTNDFQPEMLTRLTLGVIANARGSIAGSGRIDWNRRGVQSTGDFATDKMDFAAAFGPVTGLAGKIHFSDLLGLETPPGQVVTLASVNPGVSVENGVIHYQLLPDQIVGIEDGHWPFAGGELLLDPTRLDFGKPSDRHLSFRIRGMDAAQFVQQFEFKNIAVTGIFDGVLPMIFDAQGGRIQGGRLVVRKSGGRLAYVGEISNEQLGRFGNMAFDALKSIRYSNLAIELNGSLDGEIVSKVIFSGTNEAPVAARKGLLSGLTGLPFKFNITITAPFRSLVNSAQSINDPRGLVKGALEQQRARQVAPQSVQPQESETVR